MNSGYSFIISGSPGSKFGRPKILKTNIKNRVDLSKLTTFTIDPENTQDFDDAISIQKNNNTVELYIHIADVSTFVEESSIIDRLAKIRANSYYFYDKTIHMLPKILSTDPMPV